jgi:transcriptional regulator with XRE-family HTH domain
MRYSRRMSEQPTSAGVPEWDLADRMRKALRTADVGVQEMAEYLGVGRNTVSTWINGRIIPSRQSVRLWALRTGVPFEWLETGQAPDGGPTPDSRYTPRDSNPEPADYAHCLELAAA